MRLKGDAANHQAVARGLEVLEEDTITACNGRYPWAAWFVSQHVHTIKCGPIWDEPGWYGCYRHAYPGVIEIDPKLDDDDWKYVDIAGVILHEAYHAYLKQSGGGKRLSKAENEALCCKEESDFKRRVRTARAAA